MSNPEASPKPLLFISHRHTDKQIADALREWIEKWGMGSIDVYQTSAAGNNPQLGNLNDRLKERLYEAQSVALIYTNAEQDWTYCMWECGVAIDPRSPDTKVVPFQCGKDVPPPFADTIRVSVHDQASMYNFAAAFLTDPGFFPRYGRAVAPNLNAKSPQVKLAAEELAAQMTALCPLRDDSAEDWPALGFMRLQLDLATMQQIRDASEEERAVLARSIEQQCVVKESDYVAAGLFGLARINPGMSLARLGSIWSSKHPQWGLDWLTSLKEQVVLASAWEFPKTDISLLQGIDERWYMPHITWVRKLPAQNSIYFDVQFFPVGDAEDGQTIQMRLPARTPPPPGQGFTASG
jgi:hypothetical protein